jgi:hypothetical protein
MRIHQLLFTIALVAVSSIKLVAATYNVSIDGLIGYWPGAGSARDLSSAHNDGAFSETYGTNTLTGGKAFNLASGKVSIAAIPSYNFKSYDGWSVGFWFNGNGSAISASNGLFLGQDSGSGFKPEWFIDYGTTCTRITAASIFM